MIGLIEALPKWRYLEDQIKDFKDQVHQSTLHGEYARASQLRDMAVDHEEQREKWLDTVSLTLSRVEAQQLVEFLIAVVGMIQSDDLIYLLEQPSFQEFRDFLAPKPTENMGVRGS